MKLDNVLLKTGDILYWDELHTYKNITDNIDKIRATTRGEQIWRVALVTDTYPNSIRVVTFSRRKLLINLRINTFTNKPKHLRKWFRGIGKPDDRPCLNFLKETLYEINNHEDWIRKLKSLCMGSCASKVPNTSDKFIELLKEQSDYV